jgi:hypothetical protein
LFFSVQQAVQEKFRQANENLDELNKWLEKVERNIASQDIPIEDIDGLKNQINALKVRFLSHDMKCKSY